MASWYCLVAFDTFLTVAVAAVVDSVISSIPYYPESSHNKLSFRCVNGGPSDVLVKA